MHFGVRSIVVVKNGKDYSCTTTTNQKKMSDDRLRVKLIAAGYEEENVRESESIRSL